MTLVGQYEEALRLHPRREDETLPEYMERIKHLAEGTEAPRVLTPPLTAPRLPYREPGEDDE